MRLLPVGGHDAWVFDRMRDCNISVHADGHKAQDGGGAGPHIQ